MKHRLFKLVVFLMLGAVVNVAVAWGCALFIEVEDGIAEGTFVLYRTNGRFGSVYLSEWRSQGASRVYCVVMDWSDKPPLGDWTDLTRKSIRVFARAGLDEANWSLLSQGDTRWVDSRGWPLVALYSVVAFDRGDIWSPVTDPHRWTTFSGIEITPLLHQRKNGPRVWLGLRPIWPGFAINTIFYGAILWLPFAPFQLRRYMRVKRGHCIKCGYDLRGAEHEVCPECGS